jgi:hypothetical protein
MALAASLDLLHPPGKLAGVEPAGVVPQGHSFVLSFFLP